MIWSPAAQRDLHSIHDRIALDSPFYAQRFVLNLIHHADSLTEQPMRGHMVKEFGDRSIRETTFGAYRIIHRVHSGQVQIVRVFHSKRKPDKEEL